MARRPGHEECWTCETCGLTDCPDCDDQGQACPMIHDVHLPGDSTRQRGSAVTEYALVTAMIAATVLGTLLLRGAVMPEIPELQPPGMSTQQ